MFRGSFNPAPLKRKLQNRARGFQATLPEQLRRAGRLIAVSLATSTQPYGDSDEAKSLGEKATARDVRRCYATYGDVYAAIADKRIASGFWKAVQRADWARARQIIDRFCPSFRGVPIGQGFDRSLHVKARNSSGRVPKNQKPLQIVSGKFLTAYIQHEVDQVGFGKDGWGSCAKILGGTRGIPQWVTRHKAPGLVIEDHNPEHPTITLRNDVTYASQILSESDKAEAVRLGLERLTKALVTEERRIARQNSIS